MDVDLSEYYETAYSYHSFSVCTVQTSWEKQLLIQMTILLSINKFFINYNQDAYSTILLADIIDGLQILFHKVSNVNNGHHLKKNF